MVAVFRHMGEPPVAQLARIDMSCNVDRLAVEQHPAADRLANAGDRFQQFGLAIARHSGNADDFAGAQVERDIIDHGDATAIAHRQVFDRKLDLARIGLALFDPQQHAASHHQLGQFLDRGFPGFARRHHLAAAHNGHLVGDRHDLAQLVGDEDDGLALILQLAKDAEQVIGLRRRQNPVGSSRIRMSARR